MHGERHALVTTIRARRRSLAAAAGAVAAAALLTVAQAASAAPGPRRPGTATAANEELHQIQTVSATDIWVVGRTTPRAHRWSGTGTAVPGPRSPSPPGAARRQRVDYRRHLAGQRLAGWDDQGHADPALEWQGLVTTGRPECARAHGPAVQRHRHLGARRLGHQPGVRARPARAALR